MTIYTTPIGNHTVSYANERYVETCAFEGCHQPATVKRGNMVYWPFCGEHDPVQAPKGWGSVQA